MTERHRQWQESSITERIEWLWVTGPEGAVSTWFSPGTKAIIGYSACDGLVVHSHATLDNAYGSHACDFVEGVCSWARVYMGSTSAPLRGHPLVVAYDAGDYEAVYRWLETAYVDELTADTEEHRENQDHRD